LIQLKRETPPIFPTARFHFHHRHEPAFPPAAGRRAILASSGPFTHRRRLSDWELNDLDDDLQQEPSPATIFYPAQHVVPPSSGRDSFDSELDGGGQMELIRRHNSEEVFDEDFHRRYAYHTGQLNRFLFEYRALQKRLAQMQDTWGRCLDDESIDSRPTVRHQQHLRQQQQSQPHHHHLANLPHVHQRPLRPILKNRLPRHQTRRWSSDEQEPEGILDLPELPSDSYQVPSSVVDELYYS
jgi:hypothetical protein